MSYRDKFSKIKGQFAKLLNRERSLAYVCLLLSAYTLVTFHVPFFSYVVENVSDDFSGVWLTFSLFILMFALNYLVF